MPYSCWLPSASRTPVGQIGVVSGVRLAGLNSTAEQLQADPLEGRVVVGVLDQQPGRLGAVVAHQSTAGPAVRLHDGLHTGGVGGIYRPDLFRCGQFWSAAAMASNSSRRPGSMTLMLRPSPYQAYPRDAF